jgi:protein associated with RNAse G/E
MMSYWNKYLLQVAQRYSQETWSAGTISVAVGGSVGRRAADEFSDLDIILYVTEEQPSYDKDLVFEGTIVQVQTMPLPSWEYIVQHPWNERFLLETIIIDDPSRQLTILKERFIAYLFSSEGRQRLTDNMKAIFNERKQWVNQNLQTGNMYSATLASMATWAEAAFFYIFAAHHTLATSQLISLLKNDRTFAKVKKAWWLPQHIDSEDAYAMIRALEKLRAYLRDQNPTHKYKILSLLQDILDGQKARRYLRKRAYTQLIWEFAGEAFWIFLETSQGMLLEEFLSTLPEPLQQEMDLLGFIELGRSRIEALCDAGEEFLNRVALILRHPSG